MSNVILVKCIDASELYWKKREDANWLRLDGTTRITYISATAVTVDFREDTSSQHQIDYKASRNGTVQRIFETSGPSLTVQRNSSHESYFAQHSSSGAGQRWYGGVVIVSEDDRKR